MVLCPSFCLSGPLYGDEEWEELGIRIHDCSSDRVQQENVIRMLAAWRKQYGTILFTEKSVYEYEPDDWPPIGDPVRTRTPYNGVPSERVPGNGDTQYFVADDGNHGRELWKTDGTLEGTRMVYDGDPGNRSGIYDRSLRQSLQSPPEVVEDNGNVYFFSRIYSYPGRPGYEAPQIPDWVCYLMKADQSGNAQSISPPFKQEPAPGNLRKATGETGSKFFFTAGDDTNGYELWVTEGTRTTTRMVKNLNNSGSDSLSPDNSYLTTLGGSAYFVGNDGTSGGPQLFTSDGTANGTRMVKILSSSGKQPRFLITVGSTVFFVGNDDTHGYELWKSDGTAMGTTMVDDRVPGPDGSLGGTEWNPVDPQFTVIPFPEGPARDMHEFACTVCDPRAGAESVEYIRVDANKVERTFSDVQARSTIRELTAVNQKVFFIDGSELWKSDGTASGTNLIYSFPALMGMNQSPHSLTQVGDELWFLADDGVHGQEIWRSQPPYTNDSTKILADLAPEHPVSSVPTNYTYYPTYSEDRPMKRRLNTQNFIGGAPAQIGSKQFVPLFIKTTDETIDETTEESREVITSLYSGGTPESTVFKIDLLHPKSPIGGSPDKSYQPEQADFVEMFIQVEGEFVLLGGVSFFIADDGEHGMELWRTDGTVDGTYLVKDICAVNWPEFPIAGASGLTVFRDKLFFQGNNAQGWDSDYPCLWTSDGTAEGTVLLADHCLGPREFCVAGNTLFFIASDGSNGTELWKTDGTPAGTVLVKDIHTDPNESSYPAYLTAFGDSVVFTAFTPATGRELFISDGTDGGTRLVKDISPVGMDYAYTYEGDDSGPDLLTVVNGILYFVTDNGTEGLELWRSDGTTEGTVMVKDIWPGDGSSAPSFLTASSTGILYFAASHPDSGRELWKSDGTSDGTVLVKDIIPGEGSSLPDFMTAYGNDGLLFFSADDRIAGRELWITDGSAEGTGLVGDIYPGAGSSDPLYLTTVYFETEQNFVLFFYADDGETGADPWCFNPALAETSVGPVWKLH
ncbi:MAG TPA: hypothetical protein PLY86_20845 [bacterium]|nr:hypothetical protein [bacterium]